MGYKIEDPLFITAESVGASHKRERIFVLAHGPSERWRKDVASAAGRGPDVDERGEGIADAERPRRPAAGSRRALDAGSEPQPGLSDDLADAERSGSRGQRVSRRGSKRRGEVGRAGEAVGNSSGAPTQSLTAGSRSRDSVGQSSQLNPVIDWVQLANQACSHMAPAPTGEQSQNTSGRRLNPAFVCWLMGAPWFWTRAEPISFGAREMQSFHFALQSRLSSLCGG